jgi:hypothetical protein
MPGNWRAAALKLSARFHTRSWAGSIGKRNNTIQPAFSANNWNCFRSLATSPSRLIGDIALKDGEPQAHAHVVVGRSGGIAHDGHLLEARVRPTCELILTESPTHLQKKLDPTQVADFSAITARPTTFTQKMQHLTAKHCPKPLEDVVDSCPKPAIVVRAVPVKGSRRQFFAN